MRRWIAGICAVVTLTALYLPAWAEPLRLSVADCRVAADASTGEPVLSFRLTAESARAFADFTEANIGRVVELRVDGVVLSAPIIRERIPGPSGQISGNFNAGELDTIAAKLRSGAKIEVEARSG